MINKLINNVKNNIAVVSLIFILMCIAVFKTMFDINMNNIIITKDENIKETMAPGLIPNQNDRFIQRINEKYKNSNIEVYYPITTYELLNKEVKGLIDNKIYTFKENIKDDVKYSMFINFDYYKYENYIGIVFSILEDYAGAHPNTYIFTINYNIKDNCIINIDTLVNKNNNILNLMSKYTYKNLANNDKIKEVNLPYMLINGTKPIKTNFKNFIFTSDGIMVFFEKYQVAPFVYGEFWVNIPYLELNLKVSD